MSAPKPPPILQLIDPPDESTVNLARQIINFQRHIETILPDPVPPDPDLPPTVAQFLEALLVRKAVFVHEQRVPLDAEIDNDEVRSWHAVILASLVEGEPPRPAATARLVKASLKPHGHGKEEHGNEHGAPPPKVQDTDSSWRGEPDMAGSQVWDGKELFVKIGRLATVLAFRGRGYGSMLVEKLLEHAKAHPGEVIDRPSTTGDGLGRAEDDSAQSAGDSDTKEQKPEEELPQWKGLVLAHAQIGVLKMYEKIGFKVDEGMGTWWEDGIEHMGVWRRVDIANG